MVKIMVSKYQLIWLVNTLSNMMIYRSYIDHDDIYIYRPYIDIYIYIYDDGRTMMIFNKDHFCENHLLLVIVTMHIFSLFQRGRYTTNQIVI